MSRRAVRIFTYQVSAHDDGTYGDEEGIVAIQFKKRLDPT